MTRIDYHKDGYFKKRDARAKKEAVEAYGAKCLCCGESRIEFLTIDHIFGGGNKHYEELGPRLYHWLNNHGFMRVGFRTLCWNCNEAYERYPYCPHHPEESRVQRFPKVLCYSNRKLKSNDGGPMKISLTKEEWSTISSIIRKNGYEHIWHIEEDSKGKRYAIHRIKDNYLRRYEL